MAPAIHTGLFILLLYSQGICAQQGLSTNLNLGLNSAVSLSQQALQRSTGSNNQNQIPTNACLNFNLPQQSNVQQVQQQSFNSQQPNVQQMGNLQQQLNQQQPLSPITNSQSARQQTQLQNSESSFSSLTNTRLSGLPSAVPQATGNSSPTVSQSPSLQITSCSFKPTVDLSSLGQSQNQFGTIFTIPASVINKSQLSNAPSSKSTSVVEASKNPPTFTFQAVSNLTPQSNVSPQQNQQATVQTSPTAQNPLTDVQNQMVNLQLQSYYTQNQVSNSGQNQPLVTSTQNQPTFFTVQNQPGLTSEQNQPAVFTVQGQTSLNSMQNQPTVFTVQDQSSLISAQNQPNVFTVQSQPSLTPVQNQPTLFTVQGQPVLTSVQSQPILASVQSQPAVYNMAQGQPVATSLENQLPLMSILMSQLLSPTSNPYGKVSSYPSPIVETKQGSKSSGIKALLPLILNLFKEKSTGCGCRKCGCMNNNNINNNQNIQELQVSSGYSNQRKYSQQHSTNKELSQKHDDDSEELVNSSENCNQERQNYKNNIISMESSEEDDTEYEDDYDDEE